MTKPALKIETTRPVLKKKPAKPQPVPQEKTLEEKLQLITEMPMYVGNLDEDALPPLHWVASSNRQEYRCYVMVEKSDTSLVTLCALGIVSWASQLANGDTNVTISLNTEFARSYNCDNWSQAFINLYQHTPINVTENFHHPCREQKMRFVYKTRTDQKLFDGVDVSDFEGNDMEFTKIKPGDLVLINFMVQSYSLSQTDKVTEGSRLVLESLQQMAPGYDMSVAPKRSDETEQFLPSKKIRIRV